MDRAGGKRMERELRAIRIAIVCAVLGSIAKFSVGFATHSMSMVSSGVDSLGDLLVSISNLFVVRMADQEPDDEHNYGHAKIEGLGAMFEGGFIFAAGAFLIYEAIHKLQIGETSHDSTLGIIVMLPILAMTSAVVLHLQKVAKETGSLVLKSDALHYLTDVYVNIGVLVSLVLVKITGRPWIDSVLSIVIALYMLYSSSHIVRDGFDVVMDKSLDPDVVKQVQARLQARKEFSSYHDFRTRGGRLPHVDFHIVVRPDMTVTELHALFLSLREEVRSIVGPTTRVLIHADPYRDAEEAP